jgi:DNA repair exonuclease SbcCD ATPase subunit
VSYLTEQVTRLEREYNDAQAAKHHTMERLGEARRTAEDLIVAQTHVANVAQQVQRKAHVEIANVVTLCLHAVFSTAYTFRIDFERKQNKTVAELVLSKNGHDIGNPTEEDSGGVCDIISFALRLCCLLMAKPARTRLVALDEPFKFVSEEYRDNVVELMKRLAKDFDLQFIIVTHISELAMGKVVWL